MYVISIKLIALHRSFILANGVRFSTEKCSKMPLYIKQIIYENKWENEILKKTVRFNQLNYKYFWFCLSIDIWMNDDYDDDQWSTEHN